MIHPEHPHDASLPPQNPRDALKPTCQVPETSQHTKERENLGSPGPQFYACENRPLPTFPAPKFPASADKTRHEGKYPPAWQGGRGGTKHAKLRQQMLKWAKGTSEPHTRPPFRPSERFS
ncbi:hypothetical protein BDP67DRAFT_520825 [Colletotrichum lupini]|nr:hypothetical protein BDP67DRAFT_520825 [Colletotrichum lupini]